MKQSISKRLSTRTGTGITIGTGTGTGIAIGTGTGTEQHKVLAVGVQGIALRFDSESKAARQTVVSRRSERRLLQVHCIAAPCRRLPQVVDHALGRKHLPLPLPLPLGGLGERSNGRQRVSSTSSPETAAPAPSHSGRRAACQLWRGWSPKYVLIARLSR